MPQFRKLHTKTLESIDVDNMSSDFVRLTWVLLPLIVCKEGRGMMHPAWLRSNLYPLREDVTKEMVSAAMAEFAGMKMIMTYSVEGRDYFQIANWHTYQSTQREAPSPYPAPTQELVMSSSGVTQADSARTTSVSVSSSTSTSSADQEKQDIVAAICRVARRAGVTDPQTLDLADGLTLQGATPERVAEFGEWWPRFGRGKPHLKEIGTFWDDFENGRDPFFVKGAAAISANGDAWAHVMELVTAGTPPDESDPVYAAVKKVGWGRLKQMTDYDAPKLRKAFEAVMA